MRLKIYYNAIGEIIATAEIKVGKDIPPTGTFDIPNVRVTEMDISDDLAQASLTDLHTRYKLNLRGKEPTLEEIKVKRPNLEE